MNQKIPLFFDWKNLQAGNVMILKTELTSIPESDVYEILGYQKNIHTITPELGNTIS